MIRLRQTTLIALLLSLCGCVALRYADYKAPGIRFDRPHNVPLPETTRALAQWSSLAPDARRAFPTPYHVYVDAPAPGAFEAPHPVGLAFSGGGTRGVVFGAACIRELMALGEIRVAGSGFNLLDEVDYVSGVSTGAVPAAVFALNYGPNCPEHVRFQHWPDCFNVDVIALGLGTLARRPDWLLRDYVFDTNARAAVSGALAALFFDGSRYRPASGLTFADLPRTPMCILGSTIINDPAAPFVQTRLAYRYALDEYPDAPWLPGIQSFESFHSDPMPYPLGEACHNSLAYPGTMRTGLIEVLPDRPWVLEGLDGPARERMRRARTRAAYEGVCELKDGGLTDNRGAYLIARLLSTLPPDPRPLLIALDASQLELRAPEPNEGPLRMGWMADFVASMNASWQTGQDAYRRLVELQDEAGAFDLVDFRYTAWIPFLPREGEAPSPETLRLVELCRGEPLIDTPERLVEQARGIGTSYSDLTEAQMAAVRIAARFAVWQRRDDLLAWAARLHGAPAGFSADRYSSN